MVHVCLSSCGVKKKKNTHHRTCDVLYENGRYLWSAANGSHS